MDSRRLALSTGMMFTLGPWGLPEQAMRPRGTIHKAAPKVGRNDLCPCGCGRKAKHHQRLEQR